MFKILIGVVVVAIAAIVTFMVIDPNVSITNTDPNSVIIVDPNHVSIAEGYFSVSIEGEVEKSGSYVLKDGSLMGDLIDAAGGINDNADDLAFFEDADITSGMTYYIPSRYDQTNICNLVELEKVNVNSASMEELAALSSISNSVASSIISYRLEKGEFKTLEDLLDVYGIGNATYRKIRNYLTLHE